MAVIISNDSNISVGKNTNISKRDHTLAEVHTCNYVSHQ